MTSNKLPPEMQQLMRDPNECPYCNGTGKKIWGKLGVRNCIHCKGTGKVK
jgi:DnaJ-class molecular chaperone